LLSHSLLTLCAGLSGASVGRILADHGWKVLIVEKRKHIAGNCFDSCNEYGLLSHRYGPHLFHASNQSVIDFLSRFTECLICSFSFFDAFFV
jgi:UDP-galactopyranose mutase